MALASHRMAAIAGDGLALADERISLSWLELDAMLNRAANGLIARPMGGERRVAVFAANSSEAVVAYLACLHAGVSAVPVNPNLKADELAYILRESEAEILFVGPETAKVGGEVARAVGGVEVCVRTATKTSKLSGTHRSFPWSTPHQRGDGRDC